MDEEYPQELFNCRNCGRVKQDSFLLGCFHNICIDCQRDDNDITCVSCPEEFGRPNEGVRHQLNELLHHTLNDPNRDDPDAMKCATCGKIEDTVYCMDCKRFLCELGMEEYHNTIAGGDRHVNKRVSCLQALIMGEGDEEDENNFNEMLENLQEMAQTGNECQEQLETLHTVLDEKMREEEKTVHDVFEGIFERLQKQKALILEELNEKCNIMHQKLEENSKYNEYHISTVNRAQRFITKMKEHKITAELMDQLFTKRDFIETNRASIFGDIHCEMNWEDSTYLPLQIFEVDQTIRIPDEAHSTISVNIPKQNHVGNAAQFVAASLNGATISDPGKGIRIEVIAHLGNSSGKFSGPLNGIIPYATITAGTKVILEHDVTHNGIHTKFSYTQHLRVDPGNYVAKLYYKITNNNSGTFLAKYPFEVKPSTSNENMTARTYPIMELGLQRAITATKDHLYCVVKAPPEIRMYYFVNPRQQDITTSGVRVAPISLETTFGERQLGSPCGICYVDAEIYVVDTGFNCVHVFTNNGVYIERFGKSGIKLGQFQRPMGIDYDYLSKEILVADTYNNRIQACVVESKKYTAFGTNQHFKLKDPVDVKACRNGNTIVTTLEGHILLYRFRDFAQLIMTDILTPRHCCIDSTENIYVTSHTAHKVYKISQIEGRPDNFQHMELKTDPDFRFPTGIAVSENGHLYAISRELNLESSLSFLSIW